MTAIVMLTADDTVTADATMTADVMVIVEVKRWAAISCRRRATLGTLRRVIQHTRHGRTTGGVYHAVSQGWRTPLPVGATIRVVANGDHVRRPENTDHLPTT